jgi:transketolase N-terminal domain/subunit
LTIGAKDRRERLCQIATEIRRSVIEMIGRAGAGHIGSDLSAIDTLARPFSAVQINVSTLKPVDEEAIGAAARETGAIVTALELKRQCARKLARGGKKDDR